MICVHISLGSLEFVVLQGGWSSCSWKNSYSFSTWRANLCFGTGVCFVSHLVIFMPLQHLQWSSLVYNRILGMHFSGLIAITSLNWMIAYNYMGQSSTSMYAGWKEPAIILSVTTFLNIEVHTGDWSTHLTKQNRTYRGCFTREWPYPACKETKNIGQRALCISQQTLYYEHLKKKKRRIFLQSQSTTPKPESWGWFLPKVMVVTATREILWSHHGLNVDRIGEFKAIWRRISKLFWDHSCHKRKEKEGGSESTA